MQIISVDCGRNAVKAASGKRICLPSVVGEWRERKISEGGNYEVAIDGERYFVGELAESESRFRREMVSASKVHEETKILTLTAVALLAEEQDIRVVTGLPVDQHTPQVKADLIRLLSGNHTITVNGIKKAICLPEQNIAVTIEGAGAYWSEPTAGKVRILDLGSRTINAMTINNRKYLDVDSFTLGYGCLELLNASDNPDDSLAEQLARRIYADVSRRWMDYKGEPVLLAGGGALLMEQWLRKFYPAGQVINDAVFANALGYYRLGVMKWQKQS